MGTRLLVELVPSHHLPVLRQGAGKVVGAVIFGYEVEVGFLGRIKDGLNGRPAGIGDGAWG